MSSAETDALDIYASAAEAADDGAALPDAPHSDADNLFKGDRGDMSLQMRRLLAQLKRGPFLSGRRQPQMWTTLLGGEQHIRRHLNNEMLQLVVDYDQELAMVRQVVSEHAEVPVLLRKQKLAFIDSVLLLHLRERVLVASAEGEPAVVTRQDLYEYMRPFQKDVMDDVKFRRRCNAAVDRLVAASVLMALRGSEDRFEVSPILRMIFSADEVEAVSCAYAAMAAGTQPAKDPMFEDDGETPVEPA
jgi:hypothetical protein